MASHLTRIGGLRPAPLTDLDLPNLAKAIIAYERRQAHVRCGSIRGISYVHLTGLGFEALVIAEEWRKLVPYLEDGTFNTTLTPVPTKVLKPTTFDANNSDLSDPDYYQRVLTVLRSLFPTRVPHSGL